MSDWVGGGDPRLVAEQNRDILVRAAALRPDSMVLDFGCGIGRTSVSILDRLSAAGRLTGVDIVPRMIQFCKGSISAEYPNSRFHLLAEENPQYAQFKLDAAGEADARPSTHEQFIEAHGAQFDAICAFSVFTHMDNQMTRRNLRFLKRCIAPLGHLVITVFLLDPYSRRMMRDGFAFRAFEPPPGEGDSIYFADEDHPLALVAYTQDNLAGHLLESGFAIESVLAGNWCKRAPAPIQSFQDVIVARPIATLPDDFDPDRYVRLHPDLVAARVDGTAHYMRHGYFERRRHK